MIKFLSDLLYSLLMRTYLLGTITIAAPIANTTNTTAAEHLKRQDAHTCLWDDYVFYIEWSIHINNDNLYDAGGCGSGFLDNFRGRCGDVTDWTCVYDDGNNIFMDFKTSDFCADYDITAAINAASYGALNIPCVWILADE